MKMGWGWGRVFPVFHVRRDVAIDGPGERGAKTNEVGSAFDRVDVVGEGVHALVVGIVVLKSNLNRDRDSLAPGDLSLTGDVDGLFVQRRSIPVQVLDKRNDSAVVTEIMALCAALVGDLDANSRVQEGKFA
mgnify:CR=1 FL=1